MHWCSFYEQKKNMVKSLCVNDWPAESASLLVMVLPQGLLCFLWIEPFNYPGIWLACVNDTKASNELSNCVEPNMTTIPYVKTVRLLTNYQKSKLGFKWQQIISSLSLVGLNHLLGVEAFPAIFVACFLIEINEIMSHSFCSNAVPYQ